MTAAQLSTYHSTTGDRHARRAGARARVTSGGSTASTRVWARRRSWCSPTRARRSRSSTSASWEPTASSTRPGASGIPIGPMSRVVLDLARYAPGQAALTLQVTATRGTVSAAVSTTRLDGLTPDRCRLGAGLRAAGDDRRGERRRGWRRPAVARGHQHGHPPAAGVGPDPRPVGSLHLDPAAGPRRCRRSRSWSRGVSAIFERQSTAIELSAAGPVTGAVVSEQVDGPLDFAVSGVSRAAHRRRRWCPRSTGRDDAELRDVEPGASAGRGRRA